MVEFKHGDILTSDADIICQQVNCQGAMGKGLAKQVRDKYPHVYNQYRNFIQFCNVAQHTPLGLVNLAESEKGKWIANCFGQNNYGYGGIYTDVSALTHALVFVREFACARNVCKNTATTIAVPYNIGAGLGGADPELIHTILHNIFDNYEGKAEFWIYEP